MWIFTSGAFISVVASDRDPELLAVRARAQGDIERLFPEARVIPARPDQDYAFRAFLPRARVAEVVADMIAQTDYTNFKASVMEDDRHDFYMDVWTEAHAFQRWRKRSKTQRRKAGRHGYTRWR